MAGLNALNKVLVANRGEIAVRVIRACRERGIATVAVYSDPDRWALHTRLADEAHRLGPAAASESYLRTDRIIEIAQETGCGAIHPGYGFLSENADFAEQVEAHGLVFVGPRGASMRRMGDKLSARQTARRQGVPTVPGAYDPIADVATARDAAREIGYPLLIKAAAGGGGKGMRRVDSEDQLENSFERAVSEVEKSFGDPSVYLEKFIPRSKHIEVQVLADNDGNAIHLFERECSVQRRYQKLIEETPAPLLDEATRQEMGESAVAVAEGCDYRSAGTVEFIYDVDEDQYYFLEMNTRIQVEHPITEATTGVDLVGEQLDIAAGHPLRLRQSEIAPRGAAIECRIYAEDPLMGFIPATGRIEELIWPAGPGVRLDAGVARGDDVLPYYDPMVAKLVAWGPDRERAIRRMDGALAETLIAGVTTTVGFHRRALAEASFGDGSYTTDFIDEMGEAELSTDELRRLATAAALERRTNRARFLQAIGDHRDQPTVRRSRP